MQLTDIPVKFQIPWGNNAGPSFIRAVPVDSQIGIQAGAASLETGFPPVTFDPVGAGGTPPFGQDFNGILKQITQWAQWQSAGGKINFDAAFSTEIGGYPAGAFLQSASTPGSFFISIADNNQNNPDVDPTNWLAFPGTSIKFPSRTQTTNATVDLSCDTDYSIGLFRAAPAPMTVNLAASGTLAVNQVFEIADLSGNFSQGIVSAVPPSGHRIRNNPIDTAVILNLDGQVGQFKYYGPIGGTPTWSFKA